MSPRPRKRWRLAVEEAGITVYVFERTPGSVLHLEWWSVDGEQKRKSLGHRDRPLAETFARALARNLSELKYAGHTATLTLGQLSALYLKHRAPMLRPARKRAIESMIALLERHLGRALAIDDLSPHLVESYIAARKSGALQSPRHRVKEPGVRAGTIRNELHALAAMTHWAQGFRVAGKRLLTVDPLAGIQIPREKNPRRPIATEARYGAILRAASRVDPLGRFRCIVALCRFTGRRVNAVLQLRASDVLRTTEQLERALGSLGMDLRDAAHWPHGAILWDARSDKGGYEAIAPLSREARAELDDYLRDRPLVGDVPLFPMESDGGRPVAKSLASYWMRKGVKLAEQPELERGGYHTLRRLWSSERRHLPEKDVAAAGGWKSVQVMRESYQHADAPTVLSVVENRPDQHNERTVGGKRKRGK